MTQKYLPFLLTILLFLGDLSLSAQCEEGGRYSAPIFDVNIQQDISVREVIDSQGDPHEITVDIYMPADDPLAERPVVLFSFGGSFVFGHNELPDIVYLCETFAKHGYVAVAVDYRLESFSVLNGPNANEGMTKAVLRAIQDGISIVSFLEGTVNNGNPFGIDKDLIFMGGVSAGAILSTHVAYLGSSDAPDLPAEWITYIEELGGWDGLGSGIDTYESSIKGVISISGALAFDHILDSDEAPLISFHNLDDTVVPYYEGAPLGNANLPTLEGSGKLHERALDQDVYSVLETYEGSAHPPYNANPDSFIPTDPTFVEITEKSIEFLKNIVCDDGTDINSVEALDIVVSPNPVKNQLFINIPNQSETFEWRLMDYQGRILDQGTSQQNVRIERKTEWSSGLYLIEAIGKDWKHTSRVIFE